jgi:antirestriction protein ArdC
VLVRPSLEDIHNNLVAAVEGLVSSEEWGAMLEVSARFHRYSTNNQLVIYLQCPQATRVAGYRAWQRLGRQVRKGERGLAILAPCRRRVAPVERDDEPEHDEKVEILTGFRVVYVFDVSQTEGKELPEVAPRRLTGEVPPQLTQALEQQVSDAGFTLKQEAIAQPTCNGYADFERHLVVLREDLSGIQAAKTLIHELGHVLLHVDANLSERSVPEIEAESVAFVVTSALGLDTSDYSFAYVARWAQGDAELVAASAQRVTATARVILELLEQAAGDVSA